MRHTPQYVLHSPYLQITRQSPQYLPSDHEVYSSVLTFRPEGVLLSLTFRPWDILLSSHLQSTRHTLQNFEIQTKRHMLQFLHFDHETYSSVFTFRPWGVLCVGWKLNFNKKDVDKLHVDWNKNLCQLLVRLVFGGHYFILYRWAVKQTMSHIQQKLFQYYYKSNKLSKHIEKTFKEQWWSCLKVVPESERKITATFINWKVARDCSALLFRQNKSTLVIYIKKKNKSTMVVYIEKSIQVHRLYT